LGIKDEKFLRDLDQSFKVFERWFTLEKVYRCKICNKKLAIGHIADNQSYVEILCISRGRNTNGVKCNTINKIDFAYGKTTKNDIMEE